MTRFWCEPGKPAQMATLIQASGQFRYGEGCRRPPNVQVRHERLADPGNNQPGDGSRFRGRGLIAIMPCLRGLMDPAVGIYCLKNPASGLVFNAGLSLIHGGSGAYSHFAQEDAFSQVNAPTSIVSNPVSRVGCICGLNFDEWLEGIRLMFASDKACCHIDFSVLPTNQKT